MNHKVAIITQSYKNDFEECKLLCESLDRFATNLDHFIFVNDEDYDLFFKEFQYGKHYVHKKGKILPWYLVRFPFKIAGHYFHISPFTIPVREWIVQQICKLGVFDVIGKEYDAVFNIDSETVLMKPLDIHNWINEVGNFMLFRNIKDDEPSKDEYYSAAKKLLDISDADFPMVSKWNYMNTPVCFERKNLESLLNVLKRKSFFGGWKRTLCNTYRFSEYYLYGAYSDFYLKKRNHFVMDVHFFPQIDMGWCSSYDEFILRMNELLLDKNAMGLWLQKGCRKSNSKNYINFNDVKKAVYDYWNKKN